MSIQHSLVVDLDKNEITLNGMYLGEALGAQKSGEES